MRMSVSAVYEDGVLRLLNPLPLPSGTEVEVIVAEKKSVDPEEVLRVLLEIAALPSNDPKDGFSGAQHDDILYPAKENK